MNATVAARGDLRCARAGLGRHVKPCAMLLALALLGWAGEAAACRTNASCRVPPAQGSDPCDADVREAIEALAQGHLGDRGPALPRLGTGCDADGRATGSVDASFPCALWSAIAWAESGWVQFCYGADGTEDQPACGAPGTTGPTLISFDCGYGLAQVTSGMRAGDTTDDFEPARVAAEPAYNLGVGGAILASKWAATPCVGDNDPGVLEHWYFATWAYNGFCWCNNPNNPEFPWPRAGYREPDGLSRGDYPYQEIVFGLVRHPVGERWAAIPASLPAREQLCATDGCRPGRIPSPSPTHRDPCQTAASAEDDATFDPPLVEPPGAISEGDALRISIVARNTGRAPWSGVAGVALARVDGGALDASVPALQGVGEEVRPGETAVFAFPLVAPAAGEHRQRLRMQRAGAAFGDEVELVVRVGLTDADEDGSPAGLDCDDADPLRRPGLMERCDGRDADCDGLDLPAGQEQQSCTEACGGGSSTCVDGGWSGCPGASEARIDLCDGLDQDCNGAIDDGEASCPEGQQCRDATCAPIDPGGGGGGGGGGPIARAPRILGGCGCSASTSGGAGWTLLLALACVLQTAPCTRRRTHAKRS